MKVHPLVRCDCSALAFPTFARVDARLGDSRQGQVDGEASAIADAVHSRADVEKTFSITGTKCL
jgi:hypothetical protein